MAPGSSTPAPTPQHAGGESREYPNPRLSLSLPLPLALLLALFLLTATLYNCVVPTGEGPDEPGHLRYVLFLAREGRLPVQRGPGETSDVPGEGHQPPLAYVLMLPAVAWLPPDEQHIHQSANPAFLWNGGDEPAAFVRASREYWPWHGVTLAWHLARGVSTLYGAVAVFCVWGAARTLSAAESRTTLPLLAAAVVAFNPQFLLSAALVTNDTLLAALSAALFWLCVAQTPRAIHSPPPLRFRSYSYYPLAAGVLLGLALLTKQSGLLLVPLLLWTSWRAGRGSPWRVVQHMACWTGAAVLVSGWWFVRNWSLYGDPLGLAVFQSAFATQPFDWRSPLAWFAALRQLHASFWAYPGWLSLRPPAWVIGVFALLEVVALVGLLKPDSSGTRPRSRLPVAVVLLPLLALAWVTSFALTAGLVAWQGRLLFPALAALAFLLARGVMAVWGASPVRVWGLTAGLAALACWFALGVIAPAYEWRTLPPDTARQQIGTPTYARFAKHWEQGIELRGWQHHPGPQAGQTVTHTVALTWHALERPTYDWTVFVHLLDSDGEIVAKHNSRPQAGAFSMLLWTPGDWIKDAHPLAVPVSLPPGPYRLRVGLYKQWQSAPDKGSRQQVWAQDGSPMGDSADIGTLVIR